MLECKELGLDFSQYEVTKCFRETNTVADCIAKLSLSSRSSEVWENAIPDFISHLVVNGLYFSSCCKRPHYYLRNKVLYVKKKNLTIVSLEPIPVTWLTTTTLQCGNDIVLFTLILKIAFAQTRPDKQIDPTIPVLHTIYIPIVKGVSCGDPTNLNRSIAYSKVYVTRC